MHVLLSSLITQLKTTIISNLPTYLSLNLDNIVIKKQSKSETCNSYI